MRWFRFYSTALDDPKIQRLPGDLFKSWVNLLCLANEGEPRGSLPCLEDIAFRLRLPEDRAAAVVDELTSRGLLDATDETMHPHNWDERQFASDDVTRRTRKHRRSVSGNVPENVSGNVSPPFHGTPPDTDTVTEADQTSPTETHEPAAERDKPARDNASARGSDHLRADPYDLYTALCEELEAPVETPPPPKQMGIAKRLARRYDAEDVRGCLRFLVSQHWRTSPIDLATVDAQIEGWILNGRPDAEPPPRRPQPAKDPDAFDYARNLRFLTGQRGPSTERA